MTKTLDNIVNKPKKKLGFIGRTLMSLPILASLIGCPDLVYPKNYPPEITSTPVTHVRKGELYSYDVDAEDPEKNELVYLLKRAPYWLFIDHSTGLISSFEPVPMDAESEYNIKVEVSDILNPVYQEWKLTVDDPISVSE